MAWAQPAILDVAVHDGVVELSGIVESGAQKRAACVPPRKRPEFAPWRTTSASRDRVRLLIQTMEATMVAHTQTDGRRTPLSRVGRWWAEWRRHWAAISDLAQCSPSDLERLARDVGISKGELPVLAGKWPDSPSQLMRRLGALGLDAAEISRSQPQTMRDMQRVCTLCAHKRDCEHDLARYPSDPSLRDYCPNEDTLSALELEREKPQAEMRAA